MSTAINHTKPWFDYYCKSDADCQTGFSCHYKYCVPELKDGETCKDAKDTIAPFIARTNNIYHLYCDLPNEMVPQATCPTGCQPWEDCHANQCFLKACNDAELACRSGDIKACTELGTSKDDIICFSLTPHGNTHPKGTDSGNGNNVSAKSESGLSAAQVGGIAGGVSAAVVVLAAVGAFFLIKKRRAAKARRNANSDLPVYSAPDYPVQTSEKQSA
ncbi:hypothetical protein BGW42_005450 [Actinomortierella wolfii]|nr:hypothetical protein BGW42_005450 [Actinomortierella wolfii]